MSAPLNPRRPMLPRVRRLRGPMVVPGIAFAIALAAFLTVGWQFLAPTAGAPAGRGDADYGRPARAGAPSPAVSGDGRPAYRHSVVAGGVYSERELREAMTADPVVAAHYAPLAVSGSRLTAAGEGRLAYMSYRIDDRVFWTRKRVAIPAGEPMIAAGGLEIRARCGNRVSDVPMSPVSSEEPEAFEFDLLLAPQSAPAVSDGALALLDGAAQYGRLADPDFMTAGMAQGAAGAGILAAAGPIAGGPMLRRHGDHPDEPPRPSVEAWPPLVAGGPAAPPPAVPEPGTFLLMATGVGVYVLRRSRS